MKNAILLLEDDETARELMLKIIASVLEGIENNVYIAENGNEALNIIKNHGEHLILFSTDIIHPGAGTGVLIKEARNKNPDVKIILTSGSVSVEEEYNDKADFILTKPFTNEAFGKILRSIFKGNG